MTPPPLPRGTRPARAPEATACCAVRLGCGADVLGQLLERRADVAAADGNGQTAVTLLSTMPLPTLPRTAPPPLDYGCITALLDPGRVPEEAPAAAELSPPLPLAALADTAAPPPLDRDGIWALVDDGHRCVGSVAAEAALGIDDVFADPMLAAERLLARMTHSTGEMHTGRARAASATEEASSLLVASCLLARGADPGLPARCGTQPADLAAAGGRLRLARLWRHYRGVQAVVVLGRGRRTDMSKFTSEQAPVFTGLPDNVFEEICKFLIQEAVSQRLKHLGC